MDRRLVVRRAGRVLAVGLTVGAMAMVCDEPDATAIDSITTEALSRRAFATGQEIFRFDDFGDSRFWTDSLKLNDAVETLSPNKAVALGLKVDVDAVPAATLQAVQANPAMLDDPATTRALLSLNAVVGVKAKVEGDQIVRIGITC